MFAASGLTPASEPREAILRLGQALGLRDVTSQRSSGRSPIRGRDNAAAKEETQENVRPPVGAVQHMPAVCLGGRASGPRGTSRPALEVGPVPLGPDEDRRMIAVAFADRG